MLRDIFLSVVKMDFVDPLVALKKLFKHIDLPATYRITRLKGIVVVISSMS